MDHVDFFLLVWKSFWHQFFTLTSFWQLAGHWKQGGITKLEWPCEDKNPHNQFSALLAHPDQPNFSDLSHTSTPPVNKLPNQELLIRKAVTKAA